MKNYNNTLKKIITTVKLDMSNLEKFMDEWVETLERGEDIYFCECEEKHLNYICPCSIKQ